MTNPIEQVEGTHGPAYQTEYKGTAYYLSQDILGRWCVFSQRLALGKTGFGTCRHFDALADVEAKVKAFAGLDALTAAKGVAQ